jgi:dGTPase
LVPGDLPEDVAAVVGRSRSRQIGAFVYAVLDAIDRSGSVGMTEPGANALAAFRAFNFDRIYLRPAARKQADKVIGLLQGLVDFFADAPSRIPADATGMHPGITPGSLEAAEIAVRYVSGMTDRYALGLGVELLGWRPEELPRGV